MVEKKPKPKYELEEMLKVRERTKDTEDVVRKISNSECGDHILRATTASAVHPRRARNSSIITNPWEKDEPTVRGGSNRIRSGKPSKYSPTPSMKRGKAERLLKEHGSPPGIRVTAGGRIVPDGLSPLTSPRFDQGFQSKQAHERPYQLHASPASGLGPYQGWVINLGDGNVGQIVDGEVRPVDFRNGLPQLYMPAPNMPLAPPCFPVGPAMALPFSPLYGAPPFIPIPPGLEATQAVVAPQMPSARELRLLEQFQTKLEQELKDLNRNEVLQRGSLNPRKREEIVKRRIELTEQIDQNRRSIVDAKKMLDREPTEQANGALHGRRSFQQPLQPSAMFPASSTNFTHPPGLAHIVEPAADAFRVPRTSEGQVSRQPGFPEFVPRNFQPHLTRTGHVSNEALRERSSNAGLGSATSSTDEKSTDTLKPVVNGGMGLDGSFHHTRRSHAIAIKDPHDGSVRSQNSFNPASPSYKPTAAAISTSDGADQSEILNFMPSPSLIAQMDSLVRSPTQAEHHLDGSTDSHQRSETSVNTIDFFPQSPQEHSSRYHVPETEQRKTISWMPKDGEAMPKDVHTTPVRPPNKFIYNNDSPAEGYWSGVTDPMKQTPESYCMQAHDSPERSHFRESTAVTDDNRYGRGQRCSVPTPQLLKEVSHRAAQLGQSEPVTPSIAYRAGFDTGYRQDIITNDANEDFRRGYRDGMLRSIQGPDGAAAMSRSDERGLQVSDAQIVNGGRQNHGPFDRATTQATNFAPFVRNETFAASPVPGVPTNSLATTPTHTRSARKEKSSSSGTALDSPAARADFEAQPNMTISSSGGSKRARSSMLPQNNAITASPTKRGNGNATQPDLAQSSVRMRDFRESFDQQRYAKASTSVSQSNDQARGFPSQYDGSGEDDKPLGSSVEPLSPTSPSGMISGKAKPTGSPVRRKASAAVATMKQVAGIVSPRMSPGKVPEATEVPIPASPEKRAWREKWTKNFRQDKRDEQETDVSKQEHPFR